MMKITITANRERSGNRLICIVRGTNYRVRKGGSCGGRQRHAFPKARAFYHKGKKVVTPAVIVPTDVQTDPRRRRRVLRVRDARTTAEPAVRTRLLALLPRTLRDRLGRRSRERGGGPKTRSDAAKDDLWGGG